MIDSDWSLINDAALRDIELLISLYRQRRIHLPQLAQELYSCGYRMINPPEHWQNKFMSLWIAVEEVNALALDECSYKALPDHEELLEETLNKMQLLVKEGF